MTKVIYYVVFTQGRWKVGLNNKFYGAFKNKNDAIQSAMDAAGQSMSRGYDAIVMMQEKNCNWKLEWSNKGSDLFPFGNRMRMAA